MKKNNLLQIAIIMVVLTTVFVYFSVAAKSFNTDLPPEDDDSEIEVVNPYFSILHTTLSDSTPIGAYIINGPPKPPAEFEEQRLASLVQNPGRGTLSNFPSYNWVFGCSAVSGAMIAGFYDNTGYPNMYTGPTNGGEMPITDTSWPTWTDSVTDTYPNNPLVASHNGVDGRTTRGSIDDYWVSYDSGVDDPFITNGWVEHTWGTAIGDFMKTSQSSYANRDGSTNFYFFTSNAKLTCDMMEDYAIDHLDGTYGRKLFYEARGYSVGECYTQNTDNNYTGGFSLANFQAEINAGHPVLLNLEGHSVVGFGYDGSTIYIRDTWDSNPSQIYSMTWGDSYEGMVLKSVSIVHPNPPAITPPPPPTGVIASDGLFTDKIRISWGNAEMDYRIYLPLIVSGDGSISPENIYYKIYRNTIDSTDGALILTGNHPASPYDDTDTEIGLTYYYWVKACNSAGCSDYSEGNSGYRAGEITAPLPPTGVLASDGSFTDKVQVSWDTSVGAAYYRVYKNITNDSSSATQLNGDIISTSYDDTSPEPETTYYYWVKACNITGCSDFSEGNSGFRANEITAPLPPTGVLASDGSFTDKVQVSWDTSVGAAYYRVYKNITNDSSSATQLNGDIISTSYDDTSPEPETTYYYWVKACNIAGCSDFSEGNSGFRTITSLINGDFELGHVGWAEDSSGETDLIYQLGETITQSGEWSAVLGNLDNNYVDDRLSQSITVTSSEDNLGFWYMIDSSDSYCDYDFTFVKVNDSTVGEFDLCTENNSTDWQYAEINLSSYVGSTVTLMFQVTTDFMYPSRFFLDTVSLLPSTSAPLPPTISTTKGIYADYVHIYSPGSSGATYYEVYKNTSNTHTGQQSFIISALPYDDYDVIQDMDYYYWIKACNVVGCSDYSLMDFGFCSPNLINSDFELGTIGWLQFSTISYSSIQEVPPSEAYNGSWIAKLKSLENQLGSTGIMQEIQISPSQPYLHFWYQIESEDWCGYDFGYVRVDWTPVMTLDLCYENNTSDWTEAIVDLSAYAGSTIRLEILGETDTSVDSYFSIDTISLSSESIVQ